MGGGNSIAYDVDSLMIIKKVAEEKMEKIGESIVKISDMIESLDKNAMMVKSEIQESIATHTNYLRRREIQLLRQVDALMSHQKLHLQMKLAQLYHMEGCLQSCPALLQRSEMNLNNKMPFDVDELMKDVRVQNLKFHTRGHHQLQSGIEIFGQVNAARGMAEIFNLPDEEDYGDGDHHVLHKTLQDKNWQNHICFTPFSAKTEDWLRPSSPSKDKALNGSCCKGMTEEMEIENLDKFHTVTAGKPIATEDTSETKQDDQPIKWLQSPEQTPFDKLQNVYPISVSKDCKANEKCRSFGECVCELNCAVAAVKVHLTKSKAAKSICQVQDEVNQAIKECCQKFDCLQTDDLVWLRQESKTGSQPITARMSESQHFNSWLRGCELESKDDQERQEKSDLSLKYDIAMWLSSASEMSEGKMDDVCDKNGNIKTVTATPTKGGVKRPNDDNKIQDSKRRVTDMFSIYLQPLEINHWLAGHSHQD